MNLKLSTNIVVDTGPLIAFSHLDWFKHLSKLFSKTQITQLVFEESQFEQNKPGARTIAKAVQQKTIIIAPIALTEIENNSTLGLGELSSIALAKKINSAVLMDDKLARQYALNQKVAVVGTAGMLILAKRAGIIKHISPSLTLLHNEGYYLSNALIKHLKHIANE
jgi:hypothetical protein